MKWRKKLKELSHKLNKYTTNPFRALPDFIIIGVQKGGTTALFNYLGHHPQIRLSSRKEVHYYDYQFKKGLLWYKGHFPLKFNTNNCKIGEASPYYIFHPKVAERIKKDNSKPLKFILLLRNPVDRAYSHYAMEFRKHKETLSFEDAINEEENRLEADYQKLLDDQFYKSYNHQTFSYLSRGKYIEQIEQWLQVFKREQFMFIQSEDFFSDPQKYIDEVCVFLSIDPYKIPDLQPKNVGKYAEMDVATRQKLIEYYKPYNDRLYSFLNVDFGWD